MGDQPIELEGFAISGALNRRRIQASGLSTATSLKRAHSSESVQDVRGSLTIGIPDCGLKNLDSTEWGTGYPVEVRRHDGCFVAADEKTRDDRRHRRW
ncbi:MAG: hypothetical protein CM1200mP20_17350 [Pseudomonadota bacterium]|nr:MAG: hypothetical protein CM1200mP20_17350 [Pseudomonadota bacterium]